MSYIRQMDAPLTVVQQIKPSLDETHSHFFSETQGIADPMILFDLPLHAKDLPLITWTEVKVTWQNVQMEQAMARLYLRHAGQTIGIGEPFPVARAQWTPLPWLLPSIPLTNGILTLQVELNPYYESSYVNIKVAGFQQLLDRIPNYIFADKQGAYQWLYANSDNGALMKECNEFEGEEGSYILLKPLRPM